MMLRRFCKFFFLGSMVVALAGVSACSTNPATGKQQFTGLMSKEQEKQIGADEHQNIIKQYGLYDDPALQNYVNKIGSAVTADTERPDVTYKFYILDDPIVNAFALPGGYIYVSRGLLALANNEAELAAVLAHEAGHITGRHSAERYSRGVVTSLGATVLSAAIGQAGISQAIGIGSDLFMKSYSRSQENEADTLGIRYMDRAGYDPEAMPRFLASMKASSDLTAKMEGTSNGFSYFSTHPATQDRVNKTYDEARAAGLGGAKDKIAYLSRIQGLPYGDSAEQGVIRGQSFYHVPLDFTFTAPDNFRLKNSPAAVGALHKSGAVIVFDMAGRDGGMRASNYIQNVWMEGEGLKNIERTSVNGMGAATASYAGVINGLEMTIQIMAIEFAPDKFARFQVGIPQKTGSTMLADLKRATYSFRRLTATEKATIKPPKINIVAAKAGDTVASMVRRMNIDTHKEETFRVLNGLSPIDGLVAGQPYKVLE